MRTVLTNIRWRVALVAVVLAAAAPVGVWAQSADAALIRRLDALESAQKRLEKQLEEIRKLVTARPPALAAAAPPPAIEPVDGIEVSIANVATKGRADAGLVIVEYSDFQCPFCARYARATYGMLMREFVDSGKVLYAFKHLPLESIHAQAFKASEAAECARDQGRFWEMHDRLFENQSALAAANLTQHAQALKLDAAAFQSCMSGSKHAPRIRADLAEAQRLNAFSTPAFFIGQPLPGGKVKLLRRVSGAHPYSVFQTALQPSQSRR